MSITERMVSLDHYQQARGHIFGSRASLNWFINQNRPRLAEIGALVKPAGRCLIVIDRFDEAVAVIGAERANRR